MTDLGNIQGRILIFGGPYSNLAATQAMQARARQLHIPAQRIICSGDLVAYCAEATETVELIRDWGIAVVMGNCEESLASSEPDCGCGFEPDSVCSTLSRTWYEFANTQIDIEQRRWMRDLPRQIDFQMDGRSFRVIHGGIDSINQFVFPSTDVALKREQLDRAAVDVIVGGHSGIPFGQKIDTRYWLNAGVIGMPANDGSSDGWYMLIEPTDDGPSASWHRLAYAQNVSHKSTLAVGMREYGQALLDGLWPSMDILPQAERLQRGQRIQPEVLKL